MNKEKELFQFAYQLYAMHGFNILCEYEIHSSKLTKIYFSPPNQTFWYMIGIEVVCKSKIKHQYVFCLGIIDDYFGGYTCQSLKLDLNYILKTFIPDTQLELEHSLPHIVQCGRHYKTPYEILQKGYLLMKIEKFI